jgi:hypothetical protein
MHVFFSGDIVRVLRRAPNPKVGNPVPEQYQKFLNVCEGADPGIPELSDAKKRLAGVPGGR